MTISPQIVHLNQTCMPRIYETSVTTGYLLRIILFNMGYVFTRSTHIVNIHHNQTILALLFKPHYNMKMSNTGSNLK